MRFREFYPGQTIETALWSITEDAIIRFATEFDPQWFHTDPARAANSAWDGLIASGWHTCSIAMRLAHDAALQGSESFDSPGVSNLKWENPVRPGDQLRLTCEIAEARLSRSRPDLGILNWRWIMKNQAGLPVLDAQVVSLFNLAPAAGC